jgi:hypothetical protein
MTIVFTKKEISYRDCMESYWRKKGSLLGPEMILPVIPDTVEICDTYDQPNIYMFKKILPDGRVAFLWWISEAICPHCNGTGKIVPPKYNNR